MLATISAFSRHRSRLAAIAAVAVLTLGLTACDFFSSRREYEQSVVKATPFFQALQRGDLPTEAAIKAAKIGPYEPLLLSQVGFRREIKQVLDAYQAQWTDLGLDNMLDPEQITSAPNRARALAKLRGAASWNTDFENKMTAVIEAGERKVLAEMKKTPYGNDAQSKTFSDLVTRLFDYYMDLARVRTEYQRHATEILTLLDTHPKSFQVKRGPKTQLAFFDDAVLKQFNAKVEDIQALTQRANTIDARFNAAQAKTEKSVNEALERARNNSR